MVNGAAGNQSNNRELGFYPQQVEERRSRSTSRTNRETSSHSPNSRPDRSRSKSRDIVALYTASSTPGRCRSTTPVGSLRSYIYVPPTQEEVKQRSHTPTSTLQRSFTASSNFSDDFHTQNHQYGRSRSLAREHSDRDSTLRSTSTYYGRRARSETRNSSRSRDALSLCSNFSTQSRALSNSEIASQNLELWMSTSSKTQRSSSRSRKNTKKAEQKNNFVTMLEMDSKVNEHLEKVLDNANSVKPANIRMMIIAGHTPSEGWDSKDELKVKPNDLVTGLYKQNEWLYVKTKDSSSGYVPYAYTKAVKLAPLENSSRLNRDIDKSNPNTSPDVRLRTQEYRKPDHQMSTSKVTAHETNPHRRIYNTQRSSTDWLRDSLSSNNSAFIEEIMCARPSGVQRQVRQQQVFADCLVVDTDHKFDGMGDEDIRVCSDSGISEPNSNHSDEVDQYVSLSHRQLPHYVNLTTPGSRSSLESANPQEDCRAKRMYKHFSHSTGKTNFNHRQSQQPGFHQAIPSINAMPFGPLGERLQRNHVRESDALRELRNEPPVYCNISEDMRFRAQPASGVPSVLRPEIPKDYNGPRARVVYDYIGDNEDDVVVRAGEVVTILNAEDIEWIWVMKRDGVEGFMPREFVVTADSVRTQEANTVHRRLIVSL